MTLLTTNMSNVRNQLDINAKISTDALEQVRTETASKYEDIKAQFDATAKSSAGTSSRDATNAGGTGALSSSDTPLVNKDGGPEQVNPTKVEPFSLQCSYCDGPVPRIFAKHRKDCDCHFHPSAFAKTSR